MAFRKIARAFAAVAFTFVVLVFICIGGLMLQYPIRAAAWHCVHGNQVIVGNRQLTLPLLWWRGKDNDGTIVLRRGRIDSRLAFLTSELNLTPQKTGKPKIGDIEAKNVRIAILADLNKGKSRPTAFPFAINAPAGEIYCVRDFSMPNSPFLFCYSTSNRSNILFASGSGMEESEAEAILATLR